ncbi:MAG: single-stranded DNA-binding protein [Bacillota bacterium]|nr:single-stranded DNA-binding protein [Bacillota bacterium]MDW7678175.1 single-stranded DNA-binding protein [Bacillota bacterium]
MNSVVLIGRLARDPELRYTGTGKAVTTLTVAVNRGFGKDQEADFIPVVVWEKQAENCANYLTKGSQVGVQGRMQVRSYEAQNGEKRYVTEVVGNQVEFLSSSGKSGGDDFQQTRPASPQRSNQQNQKNDDGGFNPDDIDLEEFETMEDDEDLPF